MLRPCRAMHISDFPILPMWPHLVIPLYLESLRGRILLILRLRFHCTGSLLIRYESVPIPSRFHCTGSLLIRYESVPFPSRFHCTGSLLIRYKSVPFPRVYTVPVQFRSSAGAKLFLFPSRYKTVPDSRCKVVPDRFI